ncbi:MAG: nicotinate-nucleotide diphosphorylase (carboxylating) [Omnitrophica WOR_2 bacterium RIFCSPHIGHO2_02_FULL_68_15]|nr:MAG: nicotinate-nucleotide diphosphorylase (carboxylating) [Omnitrophica WOR_2 bacterium RIFCSPHIGHO2_02_FULL_68_15]
MAARLDPKRVMPLLLAALKEDIGTRDLTSAALIHPTLTVKAEIVAGQPGIVAGVPLVEWACGLLDRGIRVKPMARDGDAVQPGKALLFLEGPARPILSGERTLLNFLSRLSGIATLTRAFVERITPYPVKLLDTRKTTPGLRYLEKYAVAAGGGYNHRMGLYDQVLIKENHLQVLAQARAEARPNPSVSHVEVVAEALAQARKTGARQVKVEIEVRDLDEFRAALAGGADLVLLDHWPVEGLCEAVRLARQAGRKVLLEASGGITLDTVAATAATGVDFISIGALTRDAAGLDVSLDIV